MKNCFCLLMILSCSPLMAQFKHDYTWLIGLETETHPAFFNNCMNLLDFNDDTLKISKESINSDMYLVNASMSDNDGNLLFYSNGCYVKDASHQIMPNGDNLNPGIIYDDFCPNDGYTIPGGLIILPAPNNSDNYFIFHQALEVFNSSPFVRINKCYYSIVDMSLNGGKGDLVSKNNELLNSNNLGNTFYEGIHAVRHENDMDWWLISLSEGNKSYYRMLLSENGVSFVDSQIIGDEMTTNGGGQLSFSPDGTKFAKFDFMDQLMMFDFDRGTGLLSNYQQIEIDTPLLGFHGLAFSPNSRYLYLSTQTKLYQLDTEAPDILASKTLVGEYDGYIYEDSFFLYQVVFERMQLGPDCRIYMTPHGPLPFLHVINHPDKPVPACGFEQRGVKLPCSANYSIPNFPNYRLGTGQPVCDSNIVYVSSGYVPPPPVQGVSVWPNPASHELHLEYHVPSNKPATLWLFNATGQAVRQWEVSAGERVVSLDGLAEGMYFWSVVSDGRPLQNGKLVIIR